MTGSARHHWPHLVLTVLILIWGASYVVVKVGLAQLSPFALVAVRFWLAVACVLPFVWRARGELRRALPAGLGAGAALALGYLLQTAGMNETTASTGGLLAGLIVPLVAVGGFVFFGARIGARGVVGLLLAIGGIAAICLPGGAAAPPPGAASAGDTLRGILLQVGSSTSYAGHILLLSRFGRSLPAGPFSLVQLLLVAVAGTAAALVDGTFAATPGQAVVWHADLWLAIAYLGVLATAVGIGVQSQVQHRIPPTPLALLFALQPLFAALFGWWLLDERLAGLQLLGGALIVLGVVVTSLDRQRPPAPQ